MSALRILILSDGRPGHFNLSEGIAAALGRLAATDIERLDVRRGRWPGSVVAALATSHLPAGRMLRQVYGIDAGSVPPADVIVSAGAETLGASIWLSRLKGIPNIHYGSIRLFDPQDFRLVLTSYRRKATRPRHALALKPSRIDPSTLPHASDARSATARPWPPARAALVIGGDAPGVRFNDADWSALIAFTATLNRSHGTVWHVANSRRTPGPVSDRLLRAAEDTRHGIGQFLDVRTAGPGTLAPLLGSCNAVVCTADSSSMVSECVWMGLPTIAVTPAAYSLPKDEAAYRDWLKGRRWIGELPIGRMTPDSLAGAVTALRPLATNPQQSLASLIAERVPELAVWER